MPCATVKIQTENGPVIINKADYDEKIHTLIGAKQPTKKRAPRKVKVSG
jgi:hypothetical protein